MTRRLKLWLLIVVAWLIFAVIETSFSYSSQKSAGMHVSWSLTARHLFVVDLIWGLLLTPLTLVVCARFPLDRGNWRRTVPIHTAAMVGVAAIHALLRVPLQPFVYPHSTWPVGWKLFESYFLVNGVFDMWTYWLVAGIYHSLRYYRRYRDRELQASLLEAQLSRAQLEVLRAQLQPHFLFNTLHSISALMHEDVAAADRMVARLSDLLRMTLEGGDTQQVALKAELEFLEGYLDIERTRFQERLHIESRVAPEALDCAVPSLLLQPIVENAVRHGIARKSSPGTIAIEATRHDGWLSLSVSDDGPGVASAVESAGRTGMGLANTRARLQCLYGAAHRFTIHQRPEGGLTVSVEIPVGIIAPSRTDGLAHDAVPRPTSRGE